MSISSATNAAVSALMMVDRVAAMTSKNIANADTPGYHRLEEINYEMGSNSGVRTEIRQKQDRYLESELNRAQQSSAESTALKEGLDQIDAAISNSGVTAAYDNFMNSTRELMVTPDNPVRQKDFDIKGRTLTESMNNLTVQFGQIQRGIKQRLDLHNIELQSVQADLTRLASQPMSDEVANQISALQSRAQMLTGSISGYNKLMSSIIPPILGQFFDARQKVTDNINNSYGKDLIDINGRWNYKPAGDVAALAQTDGGNFVENFAVLQVSVGAQAAGVDGQLQNENSTVDQLKIQAQQAYGVNFVDETIKLQQYQKVYEAASLVLKVQNEMVGSLLNAIA